MNPVLSLSLWGLASLAPWYQPWDAVSRQACPEPIVGQVAAERLDWLASIETTVCSHQKLPVKCPSRPVVTEGLGNLPVVSLGIDPDDYFSPDRGIYVPGRVRPGNSDRFGLGTVGNYYQRGKASARDASVRYSDAERKACFSDHARIQILGEDSRSAPQKSLEISLDDHAFPLGDAVSRGTRKFVLYHPFRSLGGFKLDHFVVSRLLRGFAPLVQGDMYPVTLFLNGEYWGIHLLAPKEAPRNLPFEPQGGRIFKGREKLLKFYARSGILSCRQDCVAVLERKLEVREYLRFVAFQYYIGNEDLPRNHKFAVTPEGKALFLYYDLDEIFVPALPLARFLRDPVFLPLRILLGDSRYREAFLQEVAAWRDRLTEARLLASFDEMVAALGPELIRHDRRWAHPLADGALATNRAKIQKFFRERAAFLEQDLQNLNREGGRAHAQAPAG